MVRAETSFCVKKASGPSSFDNVCARLCRHQIRMVYVVVPAASGPARCQLSRPISIKDLSDGCWPEISSPDLDIAREAR
jgi:hypothetical protein